jgi:hypothetical protein
MLRNSKTHQAEMSQVKDEFSKTLSQVIRNAWDLPFSNVTAIKAEARAVRRCKRWPELLQLARKWSAWVKATLVGDQKKQALLHLKRISDIVDAIAEEDFSRNRGSYVAPDRLETVENPSEAL